jgi:hypothetical protein
MNRNRLIVGCIVFAAVTWPAMAASARYAISTDQVVTAVGKMGVRIDASQVTLLADVVATSPNSALQVRSVERLTSDRFITRLECAKSEDCLPFMASVLVDRNGATQLAAASSRLSILKGSSPESSSQPGTRQTLVRGGSRAVLQLDGAHIHIRIPVICLQSGSEGQTVRATGPGHRQIYAAKVVGDGLLQGRL